jgi:hypothetical protein
VYLPSTEAAPTAELLAVQGYEEVTEDGQQVESTELWFDPVSQLEKA